jgi:hypothetical protein|tara:strand:- start:67 stop:483 length:417 start_codon:yes stop_codon:yes gene_type:complete
LNIFVLKGQIRHKKKVMSYVQKLSEELKIDRMWSKVIHVDFKTKLDEEVQGLCWGCKKEGYAKIEIARTSNGEKLEYEAMMQTLAHEMVHAKQYLRGELDGYSLSWKGAKPRNYKYVNAPWEKEAHRLEKKLYEKCWL